MDTLNFSVKLVEESKAVAGASASSQTGDFMNLIFLILFLCLTIFGGFFWLKNMYSGDSIRNIKFKHNDKDSFIKMLFVNNSLKILMSICVTALILFSLCFVCKGFASEIGSPLVPDKNELTAVFNEDGHITVSDCNITNNGTESYVVDYSAVEINEQASYLDDVKKCNVNIEAFDGILYNGAPDGIPFYPSKADLIDLLPGESTNFNVFIDNLDFETCKQLNNKNLFNICIKPQKASYSVNYDTNGGEPQIESKTNISWAESNLLPKEGSTSKLGYDLVGWYSDEDLTNKVEVSTKYCEISKSHESFVTLYAKWEKKAPILDRIEVTNQPIKTSYVVGESFDNQGMEVTAYYLFTEEHKVVTNYTWEPTGPLETKGTNTITISYSEDGITKTTSIDVTVLSILGYNVNLIDAGLNKLQVIKDLREIARIGLKEAKEIVDSASPDNPQPIFKNVQTLEDANKAIVRLESSGATVELVTIYEE